MGIVGAGCSINGWSGEAWIWRWGLNKDFEDVEETAKWISGGEEISRRR